MCLFSVLSLVLSSFHPFSLCGCTSRTGHFSSEFMLTIQQVIWMFSFQLCSEINRLHTVFDWFLFTNIFPEPLPFPPLHPLPSFTHPFCTPLLPPPPLPHSSLVICVNVLSPSYCLVFMRQLTHTETGSQRRRGGDLKAVLCLSKSFFQAFFLFVSPAVFFFLVSFVNLQTHMQLTTHVHDSVVPVMNTFIHSYVTNVQATVIQ